MATDDQNQLRCDSSCDKANIGLNRSGAPIGFSCELTPTYDQCKEIAIDEVNHTRLTYNRYSTEGKGQLQTLLCPLGEWHYDTEAPTSGYAADGSRGVYKCLHPTGGIIDKKVYNPSTNEPPSLPSSHTKSPSPSSTFTRQQWEWLISGIVILCAFAFAGIGVLFYKRAKSTQTKPKASIDLSQTTSTELTSP